MKDIQIFNNPEFGQVRTVVVDDEPWFVGKDVAVALGYSNASKAVMMHVDSEDKRKEMLEADSQNGNVVTATMLINESGLYSLVLSSKLPTAKKFKHWVTSEVLPTIRKTGSYSIPKVTPNPHYRTRMIGTAIRDVGKTSEALEKVFGVAHGMALAVSMNLVGEAYGVDMAPCKALLPAAEEVSYLNASDIAERIGLKCKTGAPNAAAANKLLAKHGLQERRGKDWHLTEKGKHYGEAKPYKNNGHSGYQIMWSDKVIAALG
ncbi:MAG: hypothetical protein MR959_03270 [Selenomonas bovis]|nr:hypothetical protein [Selenomonas bovis]